MIETLAYGYSYESTRRELSNEYQHDRDYVFLNTSHPCVLEERNLSIGRFNPSSAEATFVQSTRTQKIFKKHFNPVMFVFIGKL